MKTEDESEGDSGRILRLTEDERALLVKACQRYRATVPAYLKSREDERTLLDQLLEKLS